MLNLDHRSEATGHLKLSNCFTLITWLHEMVTLSSQIKDWLLLRIHQAVSGTSTTNYNLMEPDYNEVSITRGPLLSLHS